MSIELVSRLPGSVLPQARAAESVEAGQHLKWKSSWLSEAPTIRVLDLNSSRCGSRDQPFKLPHHSKDWLCTTVLQCLRSTDWDLVFQRTCEAITGTRTLNTGSSWARKYLSLVLLAGWDLDKRFKQWQGREDTKVLCNLNFFESLIQLVQSWSTLTMSMNGSYVPSVPKEFTTSFCHNHPT